MIFHRTRSNCHQRGLQVYGPVLCGKPIDVLAHIREPHPNKNPSFFPQLHLDASSGIQDSCSCHSVTDGMKLTVTSIYRLAPENRQKEHLNKSPTVAVTLPEEPSSTETSDAWSRLRKQSWARLFQKVYEVDPFVSPKCQGAMSVVAIIEDPKELTKIIVWAKQQEQER